MKKSVGRTAAVVLSGALVIGSLAGCGAAKLDGTKTVATVDGTDIPMGVLSLDVRSQQASMEYMYSYYIQAGYISTLWDQTVDVEGEETYGDQMVSTALEDVELMYLLKSHAADYGVELTADDEKAIADAAAQFMADNTEETIKELSVTEDQVKEYLELETYRERMHDPIVADVDTEVSDEEAQQSSFTYVNIPYDAEEEDADDADTEVEDAEAEAEDADDADVEVEDTDVETEDADDADVEVEDADAETEDAEDADTEVEDADVDAEDADADADDADAADSMDALTKAEAVLKAMQEDPSADMTEVAKTIDESLYSYSGTFTTNEPESEDADDEDEDTSYSSYPDELIDALRGLKDGELADQVIETENGYYIARLDQVFDEDATESEKESIVSDRQDARYTEVTDGWKEAAKITVDEKVLATLKVTDSHTFTLKEEEPEETDVTEDAEAEDETGDEVDDAEAAEESEVTDETTEEGDEPAEADEEAEAGEDADDTEVTGEADADN